MYVLASSIYVPYANCENDNITNSTWPWLLLFRQAFILGVGWIWFELRKCFTFCSKTLINYITWHPIHYLTIRCLKWNPLNALHCNPWWTICTMRKIDYLHRGMHDKSNQLVQDDYHLTPSNEERWCSRSPFSPTRRFVSFLTFFIWFPLLNSFSSYIFSSLGDLHILGKSMLLFIIVFVSLDKLGYYSRWSWLLRDLFSTRLKTRWLVQ